MPTYEYVCTKCGDRFEQFQTMSATPLKTCPQDMCAKKKWGKGKVRRAIGGGAGLIFKGSPHTQALIDGLVDAAQTWSFTAPLPSTTN